MTWNAAIDWSKEQLEEAIELLMAMIVEDCPQEEIYDMHNACAERLKLHQRLIYINDRLAKKYPKTQV